MSRTGSLVDRQPTRRWPTGCHLLLHSQAGSEAFGLQASETGRNGRAQARREH